MAKAKLTKVKSHETGKTVKVECPECYEEFGSEACIRPAHGSFAHIENQVKDVKKTLACVCLQDEHRADCPAVAIGRCHFQSLYKARVAQDENAPVEKEILATAIVRISESVKKLYDSGLNKHAVIALIADDTKLGKKTIETVLNSLYDLRKVYTK